jgi:prepilin-type N-terminal cleavage/methylation domain-containing protein
MRQRTKGLTLAELIVSLSILAVVMVFCSMLFVTSWRRFQMTCAMQDAQNSAMIGMDHFIRDFNETSCFNINNNTVQNSAGSFQPSFIFFPSPRDKTGSYNITVSTGDPEWKTWLIYYLYNEPGAQGYLLVRKQVDWNPLMPPTENDTKDMNGVTVVARGVDQFWVQHNVNSPDSYYFYTAEIWTKREFRGNTYRYKTDHSFIFSDLLQR